MYILHLPLESNLDLYERAVPARLILDMKVTARFPLINT